MKTIVFLRNNIPDPKMMKRLSLFKESNKVYFIYWDRQPEINTTSFVMDGVEVIRIPIQADPFNPLRRIREFFKFKKQATQIIKNIQPNIVYAEALDMLLIARDYKVKCNKSTKIVYEIADLHRYMIDTPNNAFMGAVKRILVSMDEKYSRDVSCLVLTSEKYYEIYFSKFYPRDKMIFIPNMPDVTSFEGYTPKEHTVPRTIGFVGALRYIDELKLLIKAAKITNWNVLMAGNEVGEEIKQLCIDNNFEYFGAFDYKKDISNIYGKCDAVYCVYNSDLQNCRVALPNKLYEAVYCELPIIVAKHTYLEDLVLEWNVGFSVEHNSVEELCSVLETLSDNSTYLQIVDSCKSNKYRIDEQYYSKVLFNKITNF